MRLRVMSFNVRYGTAEDGDHVWPLRREACLATIGRHSADLVCLQEALDFQIEEILSRLPEYRLIGVGRDDGASRGEFAAILYRHAAFEPRAAGTFWFSATPSVPGSRHPGCFHPRICSWAHFPGFNIYNVHLDNESSAARISAVQQLLGVAQGPCAIIAGDFNAPESDACIQEMRRAGYRDSYRVIKPDPPAQTYHGFGKVSNDEKIDTIWIGEGWSVQDAAIDTAQIGGKWPSDHFPVLGDLYADE
jgi:endonuclease/exonuclease/phosphatase family metal-dependent hydrolase